MTREQSVALSKKRFYEKNPDYNKDYFKKNSSTIRESKKLWAEKNREKIRQDKKDYYQANKEVLKLKQKEWRRTAKAKGTLRKISKKFCVTPKMRFSMYRNGARIRSLEFGITMEQFLTFWGKPCHYCGKEIELIGLDRVDSSIGYVMENIVSCCSQCNFAKSASTKAMFIEMCRRVASRFPDLKTGDVCAVLSS